MLILTNRICSHPGFARGICALFVMELRRLKRQETDSHFAKHLIFSGGVYIMEFQKHITLKAIASILIILLAIVPLMVSCGGGNGKDTDTTSGKDTTTALPSDTTDPVTTVDESKLSIKEKFGQKNFDGTSISFLTGGDTGWWVNYDIEGPVESGETLSEALYRRNSEIDEAFNCVIIHDRMTFSAATAAIKKDVAAEDNIYDSYFVVGPHIPQMVTGDLAANLNDIDGFDFENDVWWNDSPNKALNFGGKQRLFAMGDMNIMAWKATACLMYNLTLGNQLGIENLYDVVKSGKWTVDKWIKLIRENTLDLENDGKLNYDRDRYGLICGNQLFEYSMNAMGETFAAYDEEQWPVVFTLTERSTQALEKLTELFSKENTLNVHDRTYSDGQALTGKSGIMFSEGRFLFFAETICGSFQLWDMQDNYGFLPFPKFDENQDDYASSIQSSRHSVVMIPRTSVARLNETVAVINAMGFKNHYEIKSVFFDAVFGTRSVRDPESYEMLDIILRERTFDLGVIMNFGNMVTELRNVCILGTNGFTSTYQSLLSGATKACDTFIESLKDKD